MSSGRSLWTCEAKETRGKFLLPKKILIYSVIRGVRGVYKNILGSRLLT